MNDATNTQTPESEGRLVFAGQTQSKRIGVAELHEKGDETFIVVKVFQPFPADYRDDFPDTDRGIFPGGSWEVLPHKDAPEGARPDGSLFKVQSFTLQYALWLVGALTTAINASGRYAELREQVTAITREGDDFKDVPFSELFAMQSENQP